MAESEKELSDTEHQKTNLSFVQELLAETK